VERLKTAVSSSGLVRGHRNRARRSRPAGKETNRLNRDSREAIRNLQKSAPRCGGQGEPGGQAKHRRAELGCSLTNVGNMYIQVI
jgi:hypothetical protein